jgi:hypothetical protein
MHIGDLQYRIAVGVGVAILAGVVIKARFCGDLTLPPKPPKPELRNVRADEVLDAAGRNPLTYKGFLERDSALIGMGRSVQPEEMAKVMPHAVDTTARTLAPGQTVDVLGLRLSVSVLRDDGSPVLALTIENLGDVDLAYNIVTEPSRDAAMCHAKRVLPYNAMVITARGAEVRGECVYKSGLELKVKKVETIALTALQAYYVNLVPALGVGIEARVAKGSRPTLPANKQPCNRSLSQSTRTALETGSVGWRDMIDYYGRHTCETYSFPDGYRAFTEDGQRSLPVVDP